MTRLFAAAIVILALAGCNTYQPRLTHESELTLDKGVDASPLSVYSEPAQPAGKNLSLLILPFRLSEDISDGRHLGRSLAQSFWQVWTGIKVFATQAYDGEARYYSRSQAVALARKAGADLVLGGVVSHYLHGGTRSDSSISLRIDIYDAKDGEMLWSLAQAARMEYARSEDYIVVRRTFRMPDDPMMALVQHIAAVMGTRVRAWSGSVRYPADKAAMIEALDGSPAALAAPSLPAGEPVASEASELSGAAEEVTVKILEEQDGRDVTRTMTNPDTGMQVKVEFDFDSARIRPESRETLDELGKALSDEKLSGMRFTVRGHTDHIGTEEYNRRLSLDRARAVKGYLVENFGLDPGRIDVQGFGESLPVAPPTTDEGRQMNRRVEVLAAPMADR